MEEGSNHFNINFFDMADKEEIIDLEDTFKAIDNYNSSIKILDLIKDNLNYNDLIMLSKIYINKALLYESIDEIELALKDYNNAISIFNYDKIQDRINREDKINFAISYNNRGKIFYKLSKFKNSILDYSMSLTIIEELNDLDQDELLILSNIYFYRGQLNKEFKRYSNSIYDYDKAYNILFEINDSIISEKEFFLNKIHSDKETAKSLFKIQKTNI